MGVLPIDYSLRIRSDWPLAELLAPPTFSWHARMTGASTLNILGTLPSHAAPTSAGTTFMDVFDLLVHGISTLWSMRYMVNGKTTSPLIA